MLFETASKTDYENPEGFYLEMRVLILCSLL